MRNNALYFPYISIPNTAWTMRTLLYWDKLSSIVPMEYAYRPEELDDFMRELLDAELVETVIPAQHLWRVEHFSAGFAKLLEQKLATPNYSPKRLRLRPRTRIHIEKLAGIAEILLDCGAAQREDYSWYMVEASIARLFMAYLTVCLGGLPEVDAAPVTNRWEYASLFELGQTGRRLKRSEHEEARQEILECLLPVPEGRVTLSDVVKFKRKHGELLPALRKMIEVRSAQIAQLTDPEDRADAISDFTRQSRLQVEELTDAMRFNWKKLVFGSLFPIAASGIQWASPADSKLAWTANALGFGAAVYAVLSASGGLNANQQQQPLAYVAHARRMALRSR
ncbi:DUF6236 family protein [Burkholderia gladioli]|uniref:DUF6236 family protein n=1 Tax=Burkholderia gladioli TaxID=28095 RepID=UPI0015E6E2D1|nr:DUF6236 family protein [Burkholderia gladioli]MBA1362118.1 hypothetical protein [Burkholderia gladioli]